MGSYTHREWYLFIGLVVALFVVFALWSSKRIVRVPYEDKPDLNKEPPPVNPVPPTNGIVVEELDIQAHDIESAAFKSALKEKLKGVTIREEICRIVFEEIYQSPFPNLRPEFLRNNRKNRGLSADMPINEQNPPMTNRKLELDGYNGNLGLAFECNGEFHYRPSAFTKSLTDHKYQLWKDHFKAQRCSEEGVYLIQIPYNVKKKDIPRYIETLLPHNVQKREEMGLSNLDEDFASPSYHMGDTELEVSFSSSYLRSTRTEG